MDFSFTDEQQMLRDSVSSFLQRSYDFDARSKIVRSAEGWSRAIWEQIAEIGLLALPVAEDAGGLGGTAPDLVAVAEPFGAHLLAEPFIATLLAAPLLASVEDERLEGIMEGSKLAALAYEEGHGTADPSHIAMTAHRDGERFMLDGEKRMVLAGGDADLLLVVARLEDRLEDRLALFSLSPDSDGITIKGYQTIDGRRAANIRFSGVQVEKDDLLANDIEDALRKALDTAILALCAESVGAMGELLSRTAEYASTRKQFGVPIATFQAVAHRLADMKIAYTKARATLLYTAALMEAGHATERDMAILKGQTGKLGREVGEAAIQTHGGVGMTDELAVSHLHKRILANDALLGSSEYHLRKVGNLSRS
ncbi:acyl-CoA dehydrogenase family protein [Qipengyuania sphaerica]|uniref:acyl-CoA dehydrogenase family protein n=1 Tax=Qipengyuania sphaerica TaxID=2867243 RepID=UPI001C888D06|nr:acyl-CoA dehydrogenase family protein [Qipengyuania sphaerica]MBX7539784.1 acyl-CoA dehydrogenase family protein [Qipengyuania sphaerica]